MARSFQCPECGAEIIVQYVKPGEAALCHGCGKHTPVPMSAAAVPNPVPGGGTRAAPPPPIADDSAASHRPLTFAGVWEKSFAIFGRNFFRLILIQFIVFIPMLVGLLIFGATFDPDQATDSADFFAGFWIIFPFIIVATIILQPIAVGAVLHAVFQTLLGRNVSVGGSLRVAMSRMLWILLVGFVVTLLSWLGSLLFLFPGIIIAMTYFVAVPVTVVENPGLGNSLSRSSELTRGRRWTIFALMLLIYVAYLIPSLILDFAFGQSEIVGPIIDFSLQILFGVLMSVMMAVIYHDLRVEKEGLDTHHIASVFD